MTLNAAVVDEPVAVYRLYGEADLLLYVGHTISLYSRLRQHAESQFWWSDVRAIRFDYFDSIESARVAEQAAIDVGTPKHNVVRAFGKTPISGFRIPEDVKAAAVERATAEGKTLTDVVVEYLRRYGKGKR